MTLDSKTKSKDSNLDMSPFPLSVFGFLSSGPRNQLVYLLKFLPLSRRQMTKLNNSKNLENNYNFSQNTKNSLAKSILVYSEQHI